MPAFGAVSSYGAASVLGVPFLLACSDTGEPDRHCRRPVLHLLHGRPDAAHGPGGQLCGQIVEQKYSRVLRHCAIPFIVCILYAWSPCWCPATFRS